MHIAICFISFQHLCDIQQLFYRLYDIALF